jgi:hypothetical protein
VAVIAMLGHEDSICLATSSASKVSVANAIPSSSKSTAAGAIPAH